MKAALDEVRAQFGRTYPLVIDNKPLPVTKTLDRENPSRAVSFELATAD